MRHSVCIALGALLLCACAPEPIARPPPTDAFYFPTGVAWTAAAGTDAGVLLVASSNFDKRFDRGSLTLVPLDDVGLPPLGSAPFGTLPAQLTQLSLDDTSQLQIQSFAGEMAVWPTAYGARAFVPSRAEGDPLQFVDVKGKALSCPYASATDGKDCFTHAPSLISAKDTKAGVPRAPAPVGVTIVPSAGDPAVGEVFVTHISAADSPAGTNTNLMAYLVTTRTDDVTISNANAQDNGSFIPLGSANGTNSVAVTPRWALVSGRYLAATLSGILLRLVDRQDPSHIINPSLESEFRSLEARGVAVTRAKVSEPVKRIFLAGRSPDTLLVANMAGADTPSPTVDVVRTLPLPAQPNEVHLIERPNHPPLVAITCTGANSVVLYDDAVGAVVEQIPAVGQQPYDLAVQQVTRTTSSGTVDSARLFVTDFGDGRVAVIDIDDLDKASEARLVAHLGRSQICITTPKDYSCAVAQ